MLKKHAAQMPRTKAKPLRQFIDARFVERAFRDQF
jgi:hypothetical protein